MNGLTQGEWRGGGWGMRWLKRLPVTRNWAIAVLLTLWST